MFNYERKTQSGRSMIEMPGVLAIVGVLSAGGIAGYSMVMQTYKIQAFIEKVNLMVMQARKAYRGVYGNGSENVTLALVDAGKIPDRKNPFGGEFVDGGSGDPYRFDFYTYEANIPPEACVDIVTTDWGGPAMIYAITLGPTNGNEDGFFSFPVDAADAINACKGGNKKMIFYFK